MYRITDDQITYTFSSKNKPILNVEPGSEVIFETRDASDDMLRDENETFENWDHSRNNPITGPLSINGAVPGDTLKVEIKKIKLAKTGYLASIKGVGVVKENINTKIHFLEIADNKIHLSNSVHVPISPMIGTIGTAPAEGDISPMFPGYYGGNMDNIEVKEGSVVYLPVSVKDALLSMGDCHANQGDGELNGSSMEIKAEILVKVDLIKGRRWQRPWIETPDLWVTCADAATLPEAIRLVTEDMINLIQEKTDLARDEAYMLISLIGGVSLCQACEGVLNPTVRAVIPKHIVKN